MHIKSPFQRTSLIVKGMDKLSGMTVHERLYACDLSDLWSEAVRRKVRAAMIALLAQVELEGQAELIADATLRREL